MLPRRTRISRDTDETNIQVFLDIDGEGHTDINSGIPFLDHMLDAFATHGVFDLTLECNGDIAVDPHHTIEDIALTLGTAINNALNDNSSIVRYGDLHVPLDETLAHAVIDISNRPYISITGTFSQPYINNIPTQLFAHFFRSLAMNAKFTLHLTYTGSNAHHETEALFKATGRALDEATRRDSRRQTIPSTKGSF